MLSRRKVLVGLSAVPPLTEFFVVGAKAAEAGSDLMKVSRIIVGRNDLDPQIAQRILDALSGKIDGFTTKLSGLASALGDGGDRDEALARLDADKLELALAIAQPWYTGVVGIGSEHSYDDGAVFVTFLGAEALRSVEHAVPFQSYSKGSPGWWAQPPAGVVAPPMANNIHDWAYVPPGASGTSVKADPKFLDFVMSRPPSRLK